MRIVVAGAGIAGLAAATWLRDRGHEVEVLEVAARPAGRAMTLRRPGADDIVDIGTQYYHSNYRRGRALLRRMGLDRQARTIRGRTRFFDLLNPAETCTTGHRVPYIGLGSPWANAKLLGVGAWRLLRNPIDLYGLGDYDRIDALATNDCVSDPFEWYFNARTMISAGALVEPHAYDVSYLHLIRLMWIIVMTDYLTLDRGIASLHEALAAALPVRYGTPAVALSTNGTRVAGVALADGTAIEADHVVLAVPAGAAAAMLPAPWTRERAFLEGVFQPAMQVVTLFLEGTLERGVWSYVLKPHPGQLVSFCVDAAEKNAAMVPSGRAILQAWICHPAAETTAATTDDELIAAVIGELEPLAPGLSGRVEGGHVRRIAHAVPQMPPGHNAAARRFLAAIDRRQGLSVCGDFYTGGYMESALWSAQRAVQRIAAAD